MARKLAHLIPFRPRGGTLIVLLSSMGDLLLASGAIAKISEKYKGPLYVVINDYAFPASTILDLPSVKWIRVARDPLSNLQSLLPAFRRRWDRVVHLTYSAVFYAHTVCAETDALEKIWFNGDRSDTGEELLEEPSKVYTRIAEVDRNVHELDKLRVMLDALGCAGSGRESVYPVVDCGIAGLRDPSCSSAVRMINCGNDRIVKIAICPGGRFSQKKWGNKNFAEVIKLLAKRMPEAEFCLLGGISDMSACEEIMKICLNEKVNNLCGQLSVTQSVKEIAESSLCIGNDSFALHAAIAVGTPSLVIMGGGDYPRWIPWREEDVHRMVMGKCEYYGCGWECKYEGDRLYKCVRAVTVGEVIQVISELAQKIEESE